MRGRFLRIALIGVLITGCGSEAVPTPDEQLQAAGTHARRLLTQTREATRAGRYAEALELVDSLLGVAPSLPEGHYQRGLILMALYQIEAADSAFQQAIALDPYHRGGWYQRGHVAFERGTYREAIRLYHRQKEVILSSPNALRAYYRRTDETALPQSWAQIGRVYELLQLPDSARWAYEAVLAMDSTHAQANAWLAGLYHNEGRTREALPYSRRAWRHDQSNPAFAYQLATLLLDQGDIEEALPLLEHVAAVQPWNAGAQYNLGRILVGLGRVEEGQQHLAATEQLQDLDKAIGYARAAVARFPNDPDRWHTLADLLGHAGRRQEQQEALAVARALEQGAEAHPRSGEQR